MRYPLNKMSGAAQTHSYFFAAVQRFWSPTVAALWLAGIAVGLVVGGVLLSRTPGVKTAHLVLFCAGAVIVVYFAFRHAFVAREWETVPWAIRTAGNGVTLLYHGARVEEVDGRDITRISQRIGYPRLFPIETTSVFFKAAASGRERVFHVYATISDYEGLVTRLKELGGGAVGRPSPTVFTADPRGLVYFPASMLVCFCLCGGLLWSQVHLLRTGAPIVPRESPGQGVAFLCVVLLVLVAAAVLFVYFTPARISLEGDGVDFTFVSGRRWHVPDTALRALTMHKLAPLPGAWRARLSTDKGSVEISPNLFCPFDVLYGALAAKVSRAVGGGTPNGPTGG